jgi:hypothetical protein
MTAIGATAERATLTVWDERVCAAVPLTASTRIPLGGIVMVVSGTGTALNGADTANGIALGIATQTVDTALGHTKCIYKRCVPWLVNDGTITAANIGQMATILDNQTVSLAATTTNDVGAGVIEAVDATLGVLVNMLGNKIGAL